MWVFWSLYSKLQYIYMHYERGRLRESKTCLLCFSLFFMKPLNTYNPLQLTEFTYMFLYECLINYQVLEHHKLTAE